MKTVISICNEKGGVGKTTTAFNLAASLNKQGHKVMLIDLDQQGNLSDYLKHQKDGSPTITDYIYSTVAELSTDIIALVRKNPEGIYYIPSSKNLSSINSVISSDEESNYVLKRALANPYFDQFDYIIFDCQTLLDLLVANALNASDYVVVPVQPENWSYKGVDKMLAKIKSIQKTTNPRLLLGGILITMYTKTKVAQVIDETLRKAYPNEIFETVIPRLIESSRNTLEDKSLAAKNSRVGSAYMDVSKELLQRIENKK